MTQFIRTRRLRSNEHLRNLIAEVKVTPRDLLCPLFVTRSKSEEITAMPGILRWNINDLVPHVEKLLKKDIRSFLLFGIPISKDSEGSEAWNPKGVVQEALHILRDNFSDINLFSDVCLCQYTTHGHCGLISEKGEILNDPTLDRLTRIALSHAEAGVNFVAPSDMMDGRVRAIREVLDSAGFTNTGIMAYSVKYQSAFYGPFREAADSTPQFGDRSTYQMDFRSRKEALRELELDIAEGADILMVKPALAYLDIIRDAANRFDLPLAAYNVSGEYAMVKAAAANGWIDEKRVAFEILTAIKRAGAEIIITYFAENCDLLFS